MSELRADTISASNGTGPVTLTKQSAAKAWFEYTSITTTAMTNSFNCSVLTDNGTGDTLLSFTNNMSSSAYVVNAADVSFDAAFNTSYGHVIESTQNSKVKTSSTFIVVYAQHAGTGVLDHCENMGTVHGDLA